MEDLIWHKVFTFFSRKSQFQRKSVNLFFSLVLIKKKLTDLCGSQLLQNDFINTFPVKTARIVLPHGGGTYLTHCVNALVSESQLSHKSSTYRWLLLIKLSSWRFCGRRLSRTYFRFIVSDKIIMPLSRKLSKPERSEARIWPRFRTVEYDHFIRSQPASCTCL